MTEPTNIELAQALDVRAARLHVLEQYYRAKQPLAFLSPEAKKALGSRFGVLGVNYPRLAVLSIAERLRVNGFDLDGTRSDQLWQAWLRNDLDQRAPVVHREALALGEAVLTVWARPDRKATVSVESAHQVAVYRDAGSGETLAAIKRWEDLDPAGTAKQTRYVVYRPDRIQHLVADGASITAAKVVDTADNPLLAVPVVALTNTDRVLDTAGVSEMDDLMPLVDALNKTVSDMLVASEYTARPRRWATGLELEERPVLDDDGNPVIAGDGEPVLEAVNPIAETDRMMVNESPEGKFGSLPGADLAPYRDAVDVLLQQIMAVSALPGHYVGITAANPASADGIRAAEAALTARAEAKQGPFGRAWEQVARLILAIENGGEVADYEPRVRWADPATRSKAQEADAATKLHAAGIITTAEAREALGIENPDAGPTPPATPKPASPVMAGVTK